MSVSRLCLISPWWPSNVQHGRTLLSGSITKDVNGAVQNVFFDGFIIWFPPGAANLTTDLNSYGTGGAGSWCLESFELPARAPPIQGDDLADFPGSLRIR